MWYVPVIYYLTSKELYTDSNRFPSTILSSFEKRMVGAIGWDVEGVAVLLLSNEHRLHTYSANLNRRVIATSISASSEKNLFAIIIILF